MLEEPLFCFTSDFGWASDFCLDDLLEFLCEYEIVPTVFGTHSSMALERYVATGAAEVGLHPNFLPGSSHGASEVQVIDHVQALFPQAAGVQVALFR